MAAFGKAFAAARKAGKKEFTWNGKRYNTKLAADTPKNAPTPTANPAKASSGASRSTAGKASSKSGASRSAAGKVSAKSGASRSAAGKVAMAQKSESFRDKIKKANRGMGVLQRRYKLNG